jgi:phosphatidylglycerophosphate synthase
VHAALIQAQKSNRNAPAYSRWVNRPLGRVLAATAYRLGLTPNLISLVSAAFSFSALVVLACATPSVWVGVLISLLLIIGYALDSADGQVARLAGGGTLAGEWLDHILDAFKTSGFHLAVLIMWVRNLGGWPEWTALVPLGFALQSSVWFFGLILTDLLMRNAGLKQPALAVEEGKQRALTSLVGLPADYGVLCVAMAFLGWFDLWRWGYGLLALANVLILAVQLVRWYRRVRAA